MYESFVDWLGFDVSGLDPHFVLAALVTVGGIVLSSLLSILGNVVFGVCKKR